MNQATVRLGRVLEDGPSLVVPIVVNQLPLRCIVDTGAEATVMSRDTFQRLRLTEQPSTGTVVLQGAQGGTTMGPAEAHRVTIRIGNKTMDWDVYVAPITDSFLMGLDFMLAAGVTISAGGQVHVQREPVGTTIVGKTMRDYPVSRVLPQEPSVLPAERERDPIPSTPGPADDSAMWEDDDDEDLDLTNLFGPEPCRSSPDPSDFMRDTGQRNHPRKPTPTSPEPSSNTSEDDEADFALSTRMTRGGREVRLPVRYRQ